MSSITLKSLMEEYFDSSKQRSISPSFLKEIADPRETDLPVAVEESSWTVGTSPERLIRSFKFSSIELRNYFLAELLEYEKEYGHYGKICIEGEAIVVEVYTHDLMRVTELDKEYAGQCDMIFDDLGRWGA